MGSWHIRMVEELCVEKGDQADGVSWYKVICRQSLLAAGGVGRGARGVYRCERRDQRQFI